MFHIEKEYYYYFQKQYVCLEYSRLSRKKDLIAWSSRLVSQCLVRKPQNIPLSRVTIILRTLNGLQKLKKVPLNPQGPHADKAWNTKYFKIPLFWKKS